METYNEIKDFYENQKKLGAIGMVVIDMTPGTHTTPVLRIPIKGNPNDFKKKAVDEMNSFLARWNHGKPQNHQVDSREFDVKETQSDFGLPVITFTRTNGIHG